MPTRRRRDGDRLVPRARPRRRAGAARHAAHASANVTVFATGVESPRGLRFGPDGALYVAEGGLTPTNPTSTVGQCEQVPAPIGPYMGGKTARISRIDANGNRTTVVDGLPSSRDSLGAASAMEGVADVEFVGNTLYALLSGAGCSHGVPDVPNGVIRVNADGTWTPVADYSAYAKAHPVAVPPLDDFEPDGTPYAMVSAGGTLYFTEANHTELLKVAADGTIARVVEQSAEPWYGFTALAYHDGNFYTGSLTSFPLQDGVARISKITPDGRVSVVAQGLSAVLGVAFDGQGRMYALETSTGANGPNPGTGKIVRVAASGGLETVASGLFFPTAMTFGPDGMLYVSNTGFGPATGQIVKVDVNAAPVAGQTTPTAPPGHAASHRRRWRAPAAPPTTGGGEEAPPSSAASATGREHRARRDSRTDAVAFGQRRLAALVRAQHGHRSGASQKGSFLRHSDRRRCARDAGPVIPLGPRPR